MTERINTHEWAAVARQRSELPDGFHVRAATFQPVRTAYVRQVIHDRLGSHPRGRQALVVGSGRGLLAAELARLGFAVTGLDPAPEAVATAQATAAGDGLNIDYQVGDPRRLPYADGAFDMAFYADTLETTTDLDRVLAEAARVLSRDGLFLYDTVTRSPLSRLIYLGALQSWRWTRIMPRDRYAWDRLRPPAELAAAMAAHGLHNEDVTPFRPASPLRLVQGMLRARRGDISDEDLARLAGMQLEPAGKSPAVTYLGFASKQG